MPLRIAIESPRQDEVLALVEALDAFQRPLYPAESHHGMDLEALAAAHVLFAVARDGKGQAVACGAIVQDAALGELKRMYTVPAWRGRGVARRLLALLEARALAQGCRAFALETGYLQPEAIALYERCGYRRCGPFGSYAHDPNSVFLRKEPRITLQPAVEGDLDGLVALRIEAMRESLERIGRFDPSRARERLARGFRPAATHHVLVDGERAGFVVLHTAADHLRLDHLYLHPRRQRAGAGAAVLDWVFAQADAAGLPVRVDALRGSDANRFYQRHGFVPRGEPAEHDVSYVREPDVPDAP